MVMKKRCPSYIVANKPFYSSYHFEYLSPNPPYCLDSYSYYDRLFSYFYVSAVSAMIDLIA
jgi:hypothetical protein